MWKPPRTTLLTIGSALLVIAPKCPVCFLAYFGIFGVATASVSVYRAWLPMITASWLALTVTTVAFQRRQQRQYGPALLGVVAALVLLSGKFILDNRALIGTGFALWWQQSSGDCGFRKQDLRKSVLNAKNFQIFAIRSPSPGCATDNSRGRITERTKQGHGRYDKNHSL